MQAATLTALALAAGGLTTVAHAGSVSSADTYAADVNGLALPPGTVIVLDYDGYQHGNKFVDTKGNTAPGSSKADIYTSFARVDYFRNIFGRPLVLSAAFAYAKVSDATIGGVKQTVGGEGLVNPVFFATLGLISEPQNERFLALTNYFYSPISAYDRTKMLNPGTADQRAWVPQLAYAEGLGKLSPSLKHFWVDVIGNLTVHSHGANPFALASNPAIGFDTVTQENSYNLKGFMRYQFNPLGYAALGLEKSWGGLQTYSGGALGPLPVSKDDYLKGHAQFAMPLREDLQLALDLKHDFQRVGGYKEDFAAELRITKIFAPQPSAAAAPVK